MDEAEYRLAVAVDPSEVQALRDRIDALLAAQRDAPAGGGGISADTVALADELYGTIASLKPDLRALDDAVAMLDTDDAEEREEGLDQLREALGTTHGRIADLSTQASDLRDKLGG